MQPTDYFCRACYPNSLTLNAAATINGHSGGSLAVTHLVSPLAFRERNFELSGCGNDQEL